MLLPNGKVLVVGGVGPGGVPGLKDAELYDPASGTWTASPPVTKSLWSSTATLLNDGRVFVIGGFDHVSYASGFSSDTWFWTEAGGFVAGPALPAARGGHSAVLLPNGKVLIAAGLTNGSAAPCRYPTDSQLFDPAGASGAGSWTATGSIKADRSSGAAAVLTGGLVLLTGGPQVNCPTPNTGQSEAELYDPSNGTWTATGSMLTSRSLLDLVALSNGDALAAAGANNTGALAVAETFRVGATIPTSVFSATGALSAKRQDDAAVLLQGGQVAVVGGQSSTTAYLTSVEVYDPTLRTWSAGATPLATGRFQHTATTLKDGKVLVAGGYGAGATAAKLLDSHEVLDESPGFSIGGTVSGLSGAGFVLGNSVSGGAVQQLAVSSNGVFTLPNHALSGQSYVVTIVTQPAGPAQACTVSANSGIASANVTSVVVTCPQASIVTGLNGPSTLQQNGGRLYFTTTTPPGVSCNGGTGDKVMLVPVGGGAPTPIADVDHYAGNCGVYGLVSDSTYVYWANYSSAVIKRSALDGTGVTPLFNGGQYMNALALAGGSLYFHQYPNSFINRVSTAGSGSTTFVNAGATNGQNLATDGSYLYFTDGTPGTVNQVPLNAASLPATPSFTLSGETSAGAPYVTASKLFWVQTGASGVLRVSPLVSPVGSTLLTSIPNPTGVVADANFAWVVAYGTAPSYTDGRIYKVPVGGGSAVVVAQGLYAPTSITMDAGHIYWTTTNTSTSSDGTIQMILK